VAAEQVTAHLWFDPGCPWAWVTSRWLLEVEQVRPVRAQFHVMSLCVLNEDRTGMSEQDRIELAALWGPARLAVATELSLGPDGLRALYTPLGALIHDDRAPLTRDTYAIALSRARLPHSLANAAGDPYYDQAVRASHRAALAPVGTEVGTPVVHVPTPTGGVAGFFGPVLDRVPRGEAAGRLWDAVSIAAGTPHFFQLMRGGSGSPVVEPVALRPTAELAG
jgi:mycothiol-dependent nitroreductase-like protein